MRHLSDKAYDRILKQLNQLDEEQDPNVAMGQSSEEESAEELSMNISLGLSSVEEAKAEVMDRWTNIKCTDIAEGMFMVLFTNSLARQEKLMGYWMKDTGWLDRHREEVSGLDELGERAMENIKNTQFN
jgi:hypothetical protein